MLKMLIRVLFIEVYIKGKKHELGQHLTSVTVYNHLKRVLEKIGLGHIRFHDLSYLEVLISSGILSPRSALKTETI